MRDPDLDSADELRRSARLLLLIAVLDELVIVLRGGKPTYVAAVEERHARGDFSSDV